MRSDNTYDTQLQSVHLSWSALIRESLLQTSWPISLSGEDEDDLFNFRG